MDICYNNKSEFGYVSSEIKRHALRIMLDNLEINDRTPKNLLIGEKLFTYRNGDINKKTTRIYFWEKKIVLKIRVFDESDPVFDFKKSIDYLNSLEDENWWNVICLDEIKNNDIKNLKYQSLVKTDKTLVSRNKRNELKSTNNGESNSFIFSEELLEKKDKTLEKTDKPLEKTDKTLEKTYKMKKRVYLIWTNYRGRSLEQYKDGEYFNDERFSEEVVGKFVNLQVHVYKKSFFLRDNALRNYGISNLDRELVIRILDEEVLAVVLNDINVRDKMLETFSMFNFLLDNLKTLKIYDAYEKLLGSSIKKRRINYKEVYEEDTCYVCSRPTINCENPVLLCDNNPKICENECHIECSKYKKNWREIKIDKIEYFCDECENEKKRKGPGDRNTAGGSPGGCYTRHGSSCEYKDIIGVHMDFPARNNPTKKKMTTELRFKIFTPSSPISSDEEFEGEGIFGPIKKIDILKLKEKEKSRKEANFLC
jgi:hypothetical protein